MSGFSPRFGTRSTGRPSNASSSRRSRENVMKPTCAPGSNSTRRSILFSERGSKSARRLAAALRVLGKPAHYSAITAQVNEGLAEEEWVTARHVHTLLQREEELFVRLGSGTYGLAEWGAAAGTALAQEAAQALEEAGQPLSSEELAERLKLGETATRAALGMVLQRDPRFRRATHGHYTLASWGSPVRETLAEVAAQVLAEAGAPLLFRELADRVLARRHGARSTLAAILARDKRFQPLGRRRYALVEWGLTAEPKPVATIADTAYQVLAGTGTPLPLKELADRVLARRHGARSSLSTIVKDKRFQLLGRGRYALAEWGLTAEPEPAAPAVVSARPATIADTAYQVLAEAGAPLPFRELADRVLARRHGARSSLSNIAKDKRFQPLGRGRYALAEWGLTAEPGPAATIADMVYQVLQRARGPLPLREVYRRITGIRPAALATVCNVLSRDKRFRRVSDGVYTLREALSQPALWEEEIVE